jgi:bifunctional non-homologous end joining protein LigD
VTKRTVEAGDRTVEVSRADKVFFPGDDITKGDLVDYYVAVAAAMIPHLLDRPLVLERYPDGIEGGSFFQKNASDYFPDWLRTAAVPRRRGGEVEHVICCDDAATVAYLANQGTVTFHVWPARIDDLEHPDLVVFDLDPPDEIRVDDLRDAARALRDVLDEVGLTPFVQTSGSRGYHDVAPLDRSADFDLARSVARAVAEHLAEQDPDRLTTAVRKADRGGRIFVDTGRNAYAQHAVAPYSVRPLPGAPVATPIDWDELGRVEPRSYTVTNVLRRLSQKDDPWSGLEEAAASVKTAADRFPVGGG